MTATAHRLMAACASLVLLVSCLGWFVMPPGPAVTVEVVPRPEARNPAAKAGQVAVSCLVVDGQRVPVAATAVAGTWTQETWGTRSPGDSGSMLRVVGHQISIAFVRSPWSGAVEVRGGGSQRLHDLFAEAGTEPLVVDVGAPQGWLSGALAMLAVWASVVAILRPWRSDRRLHVLLVLHVVVLHVLCWVAFPVGTNNDSVGYVTDATTLASWPGYFPPGYSWFLAIGAAVCPAAPVALVTAVQHVAMVVALLCLHSFSRAFLPRAVASGVLLLLAGMPDTLCLPQTLLSEALAIPAVAIALWAVWRAWCVGAGRAIGIELLAGCAIGVAALARVAPLLVMIPPMYCLARFGAGRWGALVRVARVVAVAAAVLGGAIVWFGCQSGQWRLTNSAGMHLFNRIVDEQHLLDARSAAGARYLAAMADQPTPFVPFWEASDVLGRSGMEWNERATLLSEVAQEGLRQAPIAYLWHSMAMSLRLLAADPAPMLPHGPVDPRAAPWERPPLWASAAPAARSLRLCLDACFAWARPLLAIAALAALAGLRYGDGRRERLAVVLLAVAGAFAVCSVEHYQPRYALALTPFTALLWPVWRWRSGIAQAIGGNA